MKTAMNAPCCKTHPLTERQQIAKSNVVTISRCACGRYWIEQKDERPRMATDAEQALGDIVRSLMRLKLGMTEKERITP